MASRTRKSLIVGLVVLVALGTWAGIAWFPKAAEPPYRFVLSWGEQGTGPGQFDQPIGIAFAAGEIFVSDAGNNRIQVFDTEGRYLRAFGAPGDGPGELARPMHLDIRAGKLYVAEYVNDRIQVFTLDGTSQTFVGSSGTGPGKFDAPGGLAVGAEGQL